LSGSPAQHRGAAHGEAPWCPAIISVGHRRTLRAFHDWVLDLTAFVDHPAAAPAVP
jgi:hypothetical protein